METESQIKQYRNSVLESLASLGLSLAVASQVVRTANVTYTLLILAAIPALCGIYLMFPFLKQVLKQEWFLNKVTTRQIMFIIKVFVWSIVLLLVGHSLITTQIRWQTIFGLLIIISAFVILVISIWRTRKIED